MTEEMKLHAHSAPAYLMQDYLKMWYTEFMSEWQVYKNCITKWQDLSYTVIAAEGHKRRFIHWAQYLMAYEEWADTHTQPEQYDRVEFDPYPTWDSDCVMEWAISRSYRYPSATAYVDHFWTGVQRRQYD